MTTPSAFAPSGGNTAAPEPGSTSTLPHGFIAIGDWRIGEGDEEGTIRGVVVDLKPKGGGKVDKKESDGKNDATTTWKGRKAADIDITFTWNRRETRVDSRMRAFIKDVHPRGPKGGEPQTTRHHTCDTLYYDKIEIEEIDGPNDPPGISTSTATFKTASWAKPAQQGQGAAKTAAGATPADQWTQGQGGKVGGQWGQGQAAKANAPAAPKVKP